jgi:hypothetical protein
VGTYAGGYHPIGTYLKIALMLSAMVPHLAPEAAVFTPRETPSPQESLIAVPLLQAPRNESPDASALIADAVPPILKKIAFCESNDRHFDGYNNVLRGKVNPNDIGRYQINLTTWARDAEKLGYDIFTEEGNTLMALYLYEKQGTKPWHWSRKCWDR